ncbi:MAG: hypothetical protein NT016_01450 [Candidatus Aenigmarchaeota archaeon]|nr:hypothetical protein [Candidatus Aenigmarchaeota archaeon]
MARRKDELDEYRKLVDDTINDLNSLYLEKKGKLRPALAIGGVFLMAAGLTGVVYVATMEMWAKGAITPLGLGGSFLAFGVGVVGFMFAHKGLKGTWL